MDTSKQTAFENEEDVLENPILFWKQQLSDIDSLRLEIPADFSRSSSTSCRIDQVSFSLSASCMHALERFSEQQDATLFTTLLAAYNTLLFRYTGQEDIVIGYPTLENKFDNAGELIGTLYNTKVFRTDLSGNPNFNELLKRVYQIVLKGNAHVEAPYKSLEDALKLQFGANYTGLYNIIFSFRNIGFRNNEINNWIANISVPENSSGAIDLALYLEETTQGLNGVWTYNSELFEAATINLLAKHFEVLLGGIVSNPQRTISQLPLLTDEENQLLTLEWNNSKINYPANRCIHELFEEQVRTTPEATALVFEKTKLTYQELNARANQLAHYLRSKGVRKETLVPICIGRSLEMIIAMWGVLKAGGAYVPIDPNYPLERIAYMLQDTGAALVICDQESKIQLNAFQNIAFVELTGKRSSLKSQPTDNLNIDLSSDNLAYVIYTSGSTGKPKGVMIEHRSLVNYLFNSRASYISDGEETAGSFIHLSFSFDASLTGTFMPLLSGKYVVIGSNDPVDIFADSNLEKYAPYDFIKITPAHLELLPANFKNADGSWLTGKLVVGGEMLRLSQFDSLIKEGINVEVINEYGPTEATVGCSTYSFYTLGAHKFMKNEVPVGRPMSNMQIYILSTDKTISPIGVIGEIYIGGAGLARGYLNRGELTAEKFIENPFSNEAGARLYKTGDLGRWLPDGNIEYLGRIDDQVKIRGYRIELGEIESALNGSGLVNQAIVLAKEDRQGNKRLVGYVVPQGTFDKQAVQNYLASKLPDYMVPALWVDVEHLPLTVNGKINRKALPDPEIMNMAAVYVAPRNATERALAEIWQKLFGMEHIGINDDFFELGGNSIRAVMMLAKVKRTLHKNFPLSFIFRARTISRLAIELKETADAFSLSSSLVPIQPSGSKTPLFVIHAGNGDILFYQSLSGHLGLDQPFYGLQAKGITGREHPFLQMEQMAGYYISEIRKVQPQGPYYLAGYCLGIQIAFEMAQQLTRLEQKVALLANLNGIAPFYHPSNQISAETNETSLRGVAKASFHLNKISKLRLKEKASYVFKKGRRKLGILSFLSKVEAYKLVFNLCIFLKQKAPPAVARLHVGRSLYILQKKYRPKAYQGSMIIFRSPGIFYSDPYLGWKPFVKDEIKCIDIPGDHTNRRDIMNEPSVHFLAKELEPFLDN